MNIATTKTFARFINKTAKDLNFECEARVEFMTDSKYAMLVGDPFDAEYYGDYDFNTGLFKVLVITYPYEYYACPQFITTRRLNEEYKRRGVRTLEELQEMLKDMLEI